MITGWIGILFLEATRQPAEIMGLFPQIDKVAHFGAFSILGLLMCGLSSRLRPQNNIPLFSLPLLGVTLCGVTEEIIQMFIPGRMASVPDLIADMGGALFAIWLTNFARARGWMRAGRVKENF